jgi:ferredoxin
MSSQAGSNLYRNWDTNQGTSGNEACACINKQGMWHDYGCTHRSSCYACRGTLTKDTTNVATKEDARIRQ